MLMPNTGAAINFLVAGPNIVQKSLMPPLTPSLTRQSPRESGPRTEI